MMQMEMETMIDIMNKGDWREDCDDDAHRNRIGIGNLCRSTWGKRERRFTMNKKKGATAIYMAMYISIYI